jgi:hypothetical protein
MKLFFSFSSDGVGIYKKEKNLFAISIKCQTENEQKRQQQQALRW